MARLTSQMKGAITLTCSTLMSIAVGFATRRFDQPSGKWMPSACVGALFFLCLLGLIFARSKEEIELSEFKRIQSAENERSATKIENETRTANATAERLLLAIQSGNLEEAERWKNFQKDQYGK